VAGNAYSGEHKAKFSVVRYGNVMGSRGSVIPFFNQVKVNGFVPITDLRMTRFMISLEQSVELVWHALEDMVGGEIYVKKIPSMKIIDLASVVAPGVKTKIVGIRPGEKMHEQMISLEDAQSTYEYANCYKILPVIHNWADDESRIKDGQKVPEDFVYDSETNKDWMSPEDLKDWLKKNR
jgi:FlaA1/EpsC-like NDP-sugar epimerase